MVERIGLTTRVVENTEYPEKRDCLSRDWSAFLQKHMPEVQWLALPNVGGAIIQYVQRWQLDGFILTGGNDLGESEVRDATEHALLGYAFERSIPVLGVCRGLQMVQTRFGGTVRPCRRERHVSTVHTVKIVGDGRGLFDPGTEIQVNSYHGYGFDAKATAGPLDVFGVAEDGVVEGVSHPSLPLLAVMWHPERVSGGGGGFVRQFFGRSP